MTDLTDILSNPPSRSRECSFGQWQASLSEKEQLAVKKALLDPAWSLSKLTNALKEFGMPCARDVISLHRRGACKSCGPI